jgi:hypothetical protein
MAVPFANASAEDGVMCTTRCTGLDGGDGREQQAMNAGSQSEADHQDDRPGDEPCRN